VLPSLIDGFIRSDNYPSNAIGHLSDLTLIFLGYLSFIGIRWARDWPVGSLAYRPEGNGLALLCHGRVAPT
jgi:hypothetical protein